MLGYWLTTHGRNVPMPVKRGVADAVRRLYTERAALRYDGLSRQIRMADVIELVHPAPRDDAQSALFRWLLDRRHHDDAHADATVLPILAAAAELDAIAVDARRARAARARFGRARAAGFSWERLSGWLPGGMDAEAWETVIPSMGVMALVRNLRNFDQAGIAEAAVERVIAKITDPHEVARARLFPYQVWAAYKHAPSDDWKRALGRTLELTVANIPALDGTLVVIDTSGSMQAPVSRRSQLQRVEVAAVMAMATAKRAIGRRRRDLRPAQRAPEGSRRYLGTRGRRQGRAIDRFGRSRDVRSHGHRALVRSQAAPACSHLHRRPAARLRSRPARPRPAHLHVQPRGLPPVGTARRASAAATRSAASPTRRSPR